MNEIEKGVAEGVAKSTEHVLDAALVPAAKESGELARLIPRTIRAAMLPLEKWVVNREVQLKKLYEAMEEKAKDIPPEKLVSPKPYVAVPALQAASYCMDSEYLRDLFAQLLVTAMNTDTKDMAHPSFVEIIKQLSPLEAKLIKDYEICTSTQPICRIVRQKLSAVPREYHPLRFARKRMDESEIWFDNLYLSRMADDYAESEYLKIFPLAIDNLIRLGLITVAYDRTTGNAKNDYEAHDEYFESRLRDINDVMGKIDGCESALVLGVIDVTALGQAFYNACVSEPLSEVDIRAAFSDYDLSNYQKNALLQL